MNFPDTALVSFLYSIINTPAVGGVAVVLLGIGIVVSVGLTLRWINQGAKADESETYTYPTPALHAHEEEDEFMSSRMRRRELRRERQF